LFQNSTCLSETENYFPDEESKTTDWMRYAFDDRVIIGTHIILGVGLIGFCAWFQTSVAKKLRTAFFWVIKYAASSGSWTRISGNKLPLQSA